MLHLGYGVTVVQIAVWRGEDRTRGLVEVLRQENIRTRGLGVCFKTREHKDKRTGCVLRQENIRTRE